MMEEIQAPIDPPEPRWREDDDYMEDDDVDEDAGVDNWRYYEDEDDEE